MPITTPFPLKPIAQDEFAAIDYEVMRHAFASQNELGRLCDEVIYQNDLAARLQAAGLDPVRTEVPVTVSHRDFSKTYFLDLIVRDSAVYELKTLAYFAAEQDTQLLNYLFLGGVNHGKLINFRPPRVESRFVNTNLTHKLRRQCMIDLRRWKESSEASANLRTTFVGLLEDWGAFLELPLYLEALVHFFGGEKAVLKKLPLTREGIRLGDQRFHLVAPDTAFRLTALTDDPSPYEHELCSLLRFSPLRAIQWINMNHHDIGFVTLTK